MNRAKSYFNERMSSLVSGKMIIQLGAEGGHWIVGFGHLAHVSEGVVRDAEIVPIIRERVRNSDLENVGVIRRNMMHDTGISGSMYDVVYWLYLASDPEFERIAIEARRLLRGTGKIVIVERSRRAAKIIQQTFGMTKVHRFGLFRPTYVIEATKGI